MIAAGMSRTNGVIAPNEQSLWPLENAFAVEISREHASGLDLFVRASQKVAVDDREISLFTDLE